MPFGLPNALVAMCTGFFPIRMFQAQAILLPLSSTALKIMSDLLGEAQLLEPSPCVPRTYHPIERADYLSASPRWVRVMEHAGQISSGSNVTPGELPVMLTGFALVFLRYLSWWFSRKLRFAADRSSPSNFLLRRIHLLFAALKITILLLTSGERASER